MREEGSFQDPVEETPRGWWAENLHSGCELFSHQQLPAGNPRRGLGTDCISTHRHRQILRLEKTVFAGQQGWERIPRENKTGIQRSPEKNCSPPPPPAFSRVSAAYLGNRHFHVS